MFDFLYEFFFITHDFFGQFFVWDDDEEEDDYNVFVNTQVVTQS